MPQYEKFHFVPCIDVGLYCDNKIIAIVSIDYKKMPRFINKNIYIYYSINIPNISNKQLSQIFQSNKKIVQTDLNSSIHQFHSFNLSKFTAHPPHQEIPRITQLFSPRVKFRQMELKRERGREKKKKIVEKRSLAFVQHQRRRVAQRAASKLAKLQSCAPYKRAEIYFQPEEQVARATNRQI